MSSTPVTFNIPNNIPNAASPANQPISSQARSMASTNSNVGSVTASPFSPLPANTAANNNAAAAAVQQSVRVANLPSVQQSPNFSPLPDSTSGANAAATVRPLSVASATASPVIQTTAVPNSPPPNA